MFFGGFPPKKTWNFPLPRIFAMSVITTFTSRTLRLKSNANYSTGICCLLSEMHFVVLRKPLKLFSAMAPPRTSLGSLRCYCRLPSRLERGILPPNSPPFVSVSAPSASRFSRLPCLTGRSMIRKISKILGPDAAWSSRWLIMQLTNAQAAQHPLHACVRVRGGHFEHTLWLSICFPCRPTWWTLCFTQTWCSRCCSKSAL